MKNGTRLFIFAGLLISVVTAEARSSNQFQRYASGRSSGGRGAWGNPASQVEKNDCRIILDCPKGKAIVNGKTVDGLVCGYQTGTGSSWSKANFVGKIPMATQGAGGAILPAGYPMLNTKPSLCGNCFIHQYPWVESGKSLGCVGVKPDLWNIIRKCGGSDFAIIPRRSNPQQAAQIAANYENLKGPLPSGVAVAAPSLQPTGGKAPFPRSESSGFSTGFFVDSEGER